MIERQRVDDCTGYKAMGLEGSHYRGQTGADRDNQSACAARWTIEISKAIAHCCWKLRIMGKSSDRRRMSAAQTHTIAVVAASAPKRITAESQDRKMVALISRKPPNTTGRAIFRLRCMMGGSGVRSSVFLRNTKAGRRWRISRAAPATAGRIPIVAAPAPSAISRAVNPAAGSGRKRLPKLSTEDLATHPSGIPKQMPIATITRISTPKMAKTWTLRPPKTFSVAAISRRCSDVTANGNRDAASSDGKRHKGREV